MEKFPELFVIPFYWKTQLFIYIDHLISTDTYIFQPKFQPTTVIKSSGGGEYSVPHPLRLGSEVSLVPQNPPSSHLGLNQQHLLTTATHQPPQQSSQQNTINQVHFLKSDILFLKICHTGSGCLSETVSNQNLAES